MGFKWTYEDGLFAKDLQGMTGQEYEVLKEYLNTKVLKIEGWMKENRRWKDNTGFAKLTLSVTHSPPVDGTVRISLAHGVKYGIWLELAHERNFAIIPMTIQRWGPEIFQDLKKLLFGTRRKSA